MHACEPGGHSCRGGQHAGCVGKQASSMCMHGVQVASDQLRVHAGGQRLETVALLLLLLLPMARRCPHACKLALQE